MEIHRIYQNYRIANTKRPNRKAPIDATCPIDTNYIGKAGECAVLSELMFRGYNANVMLIDEGIDIIAEKNNVYYYIQTHWRN